MDDFMNNQTMLKPIAKKHCSKLIGEGGRFVFGLSPKLRFFPFDSFSKDDMMKQKK